MIRAALLACLLATPCFAQPTMTDANLELVGGYRVGWYNTFVNPYVSSSTGSVYGGMAAHTFDDGTLRVWHDNGEGGKQIIESSIDTGETPMGSAAANPATWPLLDEADSAAKVFTKAELFGSRATNGSPDYNQPQGIAFDADNNRLWISVRSTYWTVSDPTQWLAAVDYPGRTVNAVQPNMSGINQQRYAGGMGIVPEAFANTHLGGRRLAFISGGYESGQGSMMGPSLCVTQQEIGEQDDTLELMRWLTTAEVDATDFEEGKDRVAQSPADYTTNMAWHYPVTNGVGYWPGASIRGNGAWLPNGHVLWMSIRGAGDQTYQAQVEGGGAPRRSTLYIFDEDVFAEVAAETRTYYQIPRSSYQFYDWSPTNNGLNTTNRRARSLSWDAGSNLLWIMYENVWTGDVETHPIVAAYQIVSTTRPQRLTLKSGSTLTLEVAE